MVLTLLTSPTIVAKKLEKVEPFGVSILLLCLASFSGAVNELLLCRAAVGYKASAAFIAWGFILNLVLAFILILCTLVFLSFFLHLLGVSVSMGRVLWTLPLSFAPWLFSAPLGLIAAAIGGGLGVALTIPGHAFLFFWAFGVLISMLAEVAKTDLLRSLLAVAMSFGMAVLLFWGLSITLFFSGFSFLLALSPPVA